MKQKNCNVKRTIMGIVVACMIIVSTGMTALAASTSTSFSYGSKTVKCSLTVDWKVGKDVGTAKTSVSGGSGTYPLGAYCNAYKNGSLLGGDNVTSFDTAQTSIKYTADEFRSSHNIQNSNRVPLKSAKLTLTD